MYFSIYFIETDNQNLSAFSEELLKSKESEAKVYEDASRKNASPKSNSVRRK